MVPDCNHRRFWYMGDDFLLQGLSNLEALPSGLEKAPLASQVRPLVAMDCPRVFNLLQIQKFALYTADYILQSVQLNTRI